MANVAYGVGNDKKNNSIPINDGLILFNTTQHTLSMDSNNTRDIYGSNNISIVSSKNLSSNLTYSKLYVDNNFASQNSFAKVDDDEVMRLGDTTILPNGCTSAINNVLKNDMRGMSITDLTQLETITNNYLESVINVYYKPIPSQWMTVGGYVNYVVHFNHQYDFIVITFRDNNTPTKITTILLDMQPINNSVYNQFNKVVINPMIYRDDNVQEATNPLYLNDITWNPNNNNIVFYYFTQNTSLPTTLRYSVDCKGYIYNK